jgi:hypothetical protein
MFVKLPMEVLVLVFARLDCDEHVRLSVCSTVLRQVSETKLEATCSNLTFRACRIPFSTHTTGSAYWGTTRNTSFRLKLQPCTLHVVQTEREPKVSLNFLQHLPSLTALTIDSQQVFCCSFLVSLPRLRLLDVTRKVALRFDQCHMDAYGGDDYGVTYVGATNVSEQCRSEIRKSIPHLETLVCSGFRRSMLDESHLASLTTIACGFDGADYHVEPLAYFRQFGTLRSLDLATYDCSSVRFVLMSIPTLTRFHLHGSINLNALVKALGAVKDDVDVGRSVLDFGVLDFGVTDCVVPNEESRLFETLVRRFPNLTSLAVEAPNPSAMLWRDIDELSSLRQLHTLRLETHFNLRNGEIFMLPLSLPHVRHLTLPYATALHHLFPRLRDAIPTRVALRDEMPTRVALRDEMPTCVALRDEMPMCVALHDAMPTCIAPNLEHLCLPYLSENPWQHRSTWVKFTYADRLDWVNMPPMEYLTHLDLGYRRMTRDELADFERARSKHMPRLHTVRWCDQTYTATRFAGIDIVET